MILDEARKLQSLAEKAEVEALKTAQIEREQRLAMKKELERLRNDEHLSNLNSLYLGMRDANGEDDQQAMKQVDCSGS